MQAYIEAGQIITGRGTVYEDGAIRIEDDGIAAVGPNEDVNGDSVELTFSLPQHTIQPGIIDAHTHLSTTGNPDVASDDLLRSISQKSLDAVKHARTTVEAGVTTVRDVGSALDVAMTVRDEIAAGSVPGPRIVACGQGLTATGGHADVTPWHVESENVDGQGRIANGVAEVREAVREQLEREADAIKVWATGGVIDPEGEIDTLEYSPEELKAIVEEADRHNVDVAAHAHAPNGILACVDAGVHSIEHGMYMDDEAMQAMAENDVYLTLTMAVMQTLTSSDAVPEYYKTNTESAIEYRRSKMEDAQEAGVKFVMGTDAGAPTLSHGENTLELECMVDAGIDPLEAIEISTRQTAEMLEMDETIGVLQDGFDADLIAVKGDPLEDITTLRDPENIDLVTVEGEIMKNNLSE
jgi:imidazolonepropionase-like amidohydrolase